MTGGVDIILHSQYFTILSFSPISGYYVLFQYPHISLAIPVHYVIFRLVAFMSTCISCWPACLLLYPLIKQDLFFTVSFFCCIKLCSSFYSRIQGFISSHLEDAASQDLPHLPAFLQFKLKKKSIWPSLFSVSAVWLHLVYMKSILPALFIQEFSFINQPFFPLLYAVPCTKTSCSAFPCYVDAEINLLPQIPVPRPEAPKLLSWYCKFWN